MCDAGRATDGSVVTSPDDTVETLAMVFAIWNQIPSISTILVVCLSFASNVSLPSHMHVRPVAESA